ncbi:hypothetical protein COU17_00965 [Candidatus Kaiserbacteria bacterium CG10_big_fil_rev_8_21_14_0_10_49_17]|uniref:Uncharacterized protein n=1 Tax=Candidatus Kaiserbacteria bacterium CG10_big_fil_rev_8_21_14_0_10_49_17 TaxID=1974609 RepID=A0A2M6WEX9_9BACT|nr:MAG: hypothetical protein COU17_00965 [Candidatus Kaiserbacteria bacterium CG10_big_fil_rev_8_21_14_0_10_49_17]
MFLEHLPRAEVRTAQTNLDGDTTRKSRQLPSLHRFENFHKKIATVLPALRPLDKTEDCRRTVILDEKDIRADLTAFIVRLRLIHLHQREEHQKDEKDDEVDERQVKGPVAPLL